MLIDIIMFCTAHEYNSTERTKRTKRTSTSTVRTSGGDLAGAVAAVALALHLLNHRAHADHSQYSSSSIAGGARTYGFALRDALRHFDALLCKKRIKMVRYSANKRINYE